MSSKLHDIEDSLGDYSGAYRTNPTFLLTLYVIRRGWKLVDIDSVSATVLCETPHDFATYRFADDGATYWGHFFRKQFHKDAKERARLDFDKRRGAA